MHDEPSSPWSEARQAIDEVLAADRAADYDRRAEIVSFRKRAGLPADEAMIEQVLAHAQRGLAHPGMWETEEEAGRRERGQAVTDAVDAYVEAHADSHTGSWYEWKNHEPTLVVAF